VTSLLNFCFLTQLVNVVGVCSLLTNAKSFLSVLINNNNNNQVFLLGHLLLRAFRSQKNVKVCSGHTGSDPMV